MNIPKKITIIAIPLFIIGATTALFIQPDKKEITPINEPAEQTTPPYCVSRVCVPADPQTESPSDTPTQDPPKNNPQTTPTSNKTPQSQTNPPLPPNQTPPQITPQPPIAPIPDNPTPTPEPEPPTPPVITYPILLSTYLYVSEGEPYGTDGYIYFRFIQCYAKLQISATRTSEIKYKDFPAQMWPKSDVLLINGKYILPDSYKPTCPAYTI